jgi:hypothetical protein
MAAWHEGSAVARYLMGRKFCSQSNTHRLPSSPAVKSFEPSGVKSTWRRDGQAMRALDSLFRYREGAPFSDAHVCESKL